MTSLKIYKAFPAYKNYLDAFYSNNTKLYSASFEEQKNALIYDGFPWILSWGSNIKDDSVEILETVHNCESLQKSWSRMDPKEPNWQIETVINQIKKFQPNICVLYPPELFNNEILNKIRGSVRHHLLVVGYDGMNRKNKDLYQGYNHIITCSEYISEFYRNCGISAYTLNFCFDPKILERIHIQGKAKYNVGFSGSIYPQIHNDRSILLKYLTKRKRIAIRSEFALGKGQSFFTKSNLKKIIRGKDIVSFIDMRRIAKMNKGPVFGLSMYQFFHDSKIGLNMHGDKIDFAANVRMYEITGVGSCLLTDWKKNIDDIFIPEKEIVTYSSVEEAFDKIKFLLKNEKVRKRIAIAGQKRTLEEYTYTKCLSGLVSFLKNNYQ